MEATIQILRSNNVYVQNIRSIYENDGIFGNIENGWLFECWLSVGGNTKEAGRPAQDGRLAGMCRPEGFRV